MYINLYRTRIDSESHILRILLNETNEVRYHKIQGYGIKDSDFDKKPNCSRRIFNHRKNDLLKSYCIRKLATSDDRTNYYQITPIGVIHLCKTLSNLNEISFSRIFAVLRFYYNNGKPSDEESYIDKLKNSWKELEKIYGSDWYINPLHEITKNIEITPNPDHYLVELYYELSYGLKIQLNYFGIFRDEIKIEATKEDDEKIFYFYDVIDERKMYYMISKFIIKAILHYLVYENTTEREKYSLMKSRVPEKKRFKKYHEEFLQFPEVMLGVVDEFTFELKKSIKIPNHTLKTLTDEIEYRFKDWSKHSPHLKSRFGKRLGSPERFTKDSSLKELLARLRLH